jgi:signal transduction histidine kinase
MRDETGMGGMRRVRLRAGFATLRDMKDEGDDLHARLPQGVLSDLGGWTLYQSFRTFTWPWLVRRGAVFWPLAVLAGSAYAAWHASGMGAWSDWPPLALRAVLASLAAVTAGPLLATFIRHQRLPIAVERVLVVAAILGGIVIGCAAWNWASSYHDYLMQQYPRGHTMSIGLFGQVMSKFLYSSVDSSLFAMIFAGGGLAAVYYMGEQRRIARHAAQLQLEKLRAERDAADMRLAVLQAQVEPHFLFNTLASVRSLIASEPGRAAQTVDALAEYLRATLPRFREAKMEDATLERQIEICTGYLALMNIRMADRIEVVVDVDAAARTLPFPPLILLTLVENAVTHGIEPKPGPGMVAISARLDGDRLLVGVEDDGKGLAPGPAPGLGLANIRAQLRSRFGDRAALAVESRAGGGTVARVSVPQ